MDALFDQQVEEISVLADTALADPDPWHALVWYLEQVMASRPRTGASPTSSAAAVSDPRNTTGARTSSPKVMAITERAKQSGDLRPDVEGTDLVFIQVELVAIVDRGPRWVARALTGASPMVVVRSTSTRRSV